MDNGTQNLSKEQQQQLLFMMLVQQHQQIAMMAMGKIKNPATDKVERDLSTARYAIDTLGMLRDYTAGNLSAESAEYLTHVLSNLRLNYVDEVNAPSSHEPEDNPAENGEESED